MSNTYVVVRQRFMKGEDHPTLDRLKAASMEVKLEANNSIVIFRDMEGRMVGVAAEYAAVYLESAVTPQQDAVAPVQ